MNPHLKTFLYGVFTALLVCAAFLKGCSGPTANDPLLDKVEPIKAEVRAAKAAKDSVHKIVVFMDRERIVYVNKYKIVRHDSLIPCEEKLIICDTVIVKDSTMISEQAQELKFANSIIGKQDTIIRIDSATIYGLNKEVRKQKRLKWLFGIIAAGAVWHGAGR